MPFAISGSVSSAATETPPELVVAVNGRVAGVIGGYTPEGDGWMFIGYLADVYQPGSNDVGVYEVRRDGGEITVHPVAVA